jgi:hypothetical protein
VRRHSAAALVLAVLLASCGGGAPADETETIQKLIELSKETLRQRHETGPTERFNQPRHTGCLRADFNVEANLPVELQVGLFSQPGSYPTWIRLANASAEPDTEEDFRGMSLKLMRVEGPKLVGASSTQDFVLNSHPVLFVGTPEDFLKFIDKSLNSSPILFFLNPFDLHLKELGIVRAGRQHHAGHLAIPYWSTTPYSLGPDRVVKYAAKPCGGVTAELVEDPTDGYLRDAMRGQLASGGACFEFMVQFQTDPESMPIEDATVEWDESVAPFHKVATVEIPPQPFESAAQTEFCENLAFNPWNSLAEHRPMGGLNRARKDLYQELAAFRHERNGVSYSEPTGDEAF